MMLLELLRGDECRSIPPHDYTAMCVFAQLLQVRLSEARADLAQKDEYIKQLQKLYLEATEGVSK